MTEPRTSPAPSLPRISEYVRWHATRTPSADAMVIGAQRITYEALETRVDALAKALLAAGVRKGDRVATLATPHPDYFIALLATSSIGAIWVGLNPRYRAEELSYLVRDAEPSVLLTRTQIEDRAYDADIETMRAAVSTLRHVVVLGEDALCAGSQSYASFIARGKSVTSAQLEAARSACGGRDPCLIGYTSGSTGQPKGAVLCHEGIIEFSRAQNRAWPVSTPRFLNYFPINHIGCVVDISCPTLVGGGCIVFMEQFDPATAMQLIVSERVTVWGSVPTVFQMQLALPDFASYDLSAVELVIWEGAAIPESTLRKLHAICPRLATNYGMTETTSAITIEMPTDDLEALTHSVGRPFEGVEIRLVGSDGNDVPDGVEGEIWTRSIYNMLGYWRRPAETREALRPDGWLRTGDLAVRRPDARYRIVGRLREMYKSGGYNVYPREIERVLETHPAVSLAAVVAVADPLWQEAGVAFVALRHRITADELERHCRASLANYKVPKRFELREQLPLLPIGKVDKVSLRREAARLTAISRTG
jgi:acyl-CoA synthetase (AMP-forming)/AMP-acid ligase II